MTSAMRRLFVTTLLALAPLAAAAQESPPKPTAQDRDAVAACLKLADENGARDAAKTSHPDEPATPQGRLEAAAKDALADPASCIGAVSILCQQQPGGYSTAGMIACTEREWAVWDERLNQAYRAALKDAEPKLSTALKATQRAWLAWRKETCKLPGIENEGGSIVGPLYLGCMMEATARQAIWLGQRQ